MPGGRIELPLRIAKRDFKSLASTNSATQAVTKFLILLRIDVKVIFFRAESCFVLKLGAINGIFTDSG